MSMTNKFIKNYFLTVLLYFASIYLLISITACAHKPPKNVNNICEIFEDKKKWLKHAQASTKKWGTPIQVQMAILQQESKFVYDAKPGRKKIMGFIPWGRKSSAYGYAQVLNETWKEYKKESGNRGADRDKFKDAIDFVGWYTYKTNKITKASKWDAYSQYLAYHEGQGGFMRKSYQNKKWLIDVAKKVDKNARNYAAQIKTCGIN